MLQAGVIQESHESKEHINLNPSKEDIMKIDDPLACNNCGQTFPEQETTKVEHCPKCGTLLILPSKLGWRMMNDDSVFTNN